MSFQHKYDEFQKFIKDINIELSSLDINLTKIEIDCIEFIYNNKSCTARDIESTLQIDRGFLSRTLKRLEKDNLILRNQSKKDKRIYELKLSAKGNRLFKEINNERNNQFKKVFAHLSKKEEERFINLLLEAKHVFSAPELEQNNTEITYLKEENISLFKAIKNDHVISTLLYKPVDEWVVKIELLNSNIDESLFEELLKRAIQYAYNNYVSHLLIYVDLDFKFKDVLIDFEFINTEKIDHHERYDLFL